MQNNLGIEILVDDVLIEKITQNKARPDVARDYPNYNSANSSGFHTVIDLTKLDNGLHKLEILARSDSSVKNLGFKNFILDKNELLPPRDLQDYVGGGFNVVGTEFFRYFIDICGLKPNQHVLDVGCGTGRLAVPLIQFLSEGSYEGFDIYLKAIQWCQNHISTRYPNFQFSLADIKNDYYNPQGKYLASEFKFPYGDNSFDLVFLTSVFTHIRPKEVENYVSEISRVLRKNGKCLITFFLINEESTNLIKQGKGNQKFVYELDGFFSTRTDIPEFAIAYQEQAILQLFQKHGIDLDHIYYGNWCGREKYLSYQDITIGHKP
ncbi:MAG: class I SAM-dependent methyltransferase [Patescibacteria group bacterium]|nr:class I SAM-dependent methyltransferase [Patescibacteria group bacterium]